MLPPVVEKTLLQKHVAEKEREYTSFINSVALPPLNLRPLTIEELLRNPAWVTVMYDPRTDRYELQIFCRSTLSSCFSGSRSENKLTQVVTQPLG